MLHFTVIRVIPASHLLTAAKLGNGRTKSFINIWQLILVDVAGSVAAMEHGLLQQMNMWFQGVDATWMIEQGDFCCKNSFSHLNLY